MKGWQAAFDSLPAGASNSRRDIMRRADSEVTQ